MTCELLDQRSGMILTIDEPMTEDFEVGRAGGRRDRVRDRSIRRLR